MLVMSNCIGIGFRANGTCRFSGELIRSFFSIEGRYCRKRSSFEADCPYLGEKGTVAKIEKNIYTFKWGQ
jgi:hypothetical protein